MKNLFNVAAGSMIGREHTRIGKNNQDAFCWEIHSDAIVAVVCDGCSSGSSSEVGAQWGARAITQIILQTLAEFSTSGDCFADEWIEQIQARSQVALKTLMALLQGHPIEVVKNYLLFTVVGAVLLPEQTWVFSLGDGVVILNGESLPLPTFANNAPPYLSYSLVPQATGFNPAELRFQIQAHLPTEQVRSLLIGSDGVQDLLAASDRRIPGKTERVGPIAQFWQSDRYFQNADQVRRRLALINREVAQPDWENRQWHRESGLLPDDTTLIVIKRK